MKVDIQKFDGEISFNLWKVQMRAVLIQHGSVSYTHLRAHETDSYLVCRLLLEKKGHSI